MTKSKFIPSVLVIAPLTAAFLMSCGSRPDSDNAPVPVVTAVAPTGAVVPVGAVVPTGATAAPAAAVVPVASPAPTPLVDVAPAPAVTEPVVVIAPAPTAPIVATTPSPTEPVVVPSIPVVVDAPSPAPSPVATIDWVTVNDAVIKINCLRCHTAARAAGGVILEDFANAKLSIDAIQKAVFVKGTMPPRKPLTDTDKAILKAWLDGGAPETLAP